MTLWVLAAGLLLRLPRNSRCIHRAGIEAGYQQVNKL